MMLYYQTKFECKRTGSLEDIVEIVIFWLQKPSLWLWHWRLRTPPHDSTPKYQDGKKWSSGSRDIILTHGQTDKVIRIYPLPIFYMGGIKKKMKQGGSGVPNQEKKNLSKLPSQSFNQPSLRPHLIHDRQSSVQHEIRYVILHSCRFSNDLCSCRNYSSVCQDQEDMTCRLVALVSRVHFWQSLLPPVSSPRCRCFPADWWSARW